MILKLRSEVEEDLAHLDHSIRDVAMSLIDKTRNQMEKAFSEENAKQIHEAASSELLNMGEELPSDLRDRTYYRIESAFVDLLAQKLQEIKKAQWN